MLESIILYVLSIYFAFHVLSRSDLLARPRDYILRSFPKWLTYPLGCCFCFTFWVGVAYGIGIAVSTGVIMFSVLQLLVAPVLGYLLDLCVQVLIRAGRGYTVTVGSGLLDQQDPKR